jgi:hypothetical protein
LLIATLVSCGDTPAEPEKAVDTGVSIDPKMPSVRHSGSLPETFADMNRQVPGFAGLHFDKSQHPVIRMVSEHIPEHALQARAVAGPFFEAFGFKIENMKVVEADFEWLELFDWHALLRPILLSDDVEYLGAEEMTNRVVVGISNNRVRPNIEERLARLEIPREAVLIEMTAPVRRLRQTGRGTKETCRRRLPDSS